MAKSKSWIQTKKVKASRAKNLGQLGTFFTLIARQTFTKLKQIFIKALILNYFNLGHYIQIEADTFGYTIDRIFSKLTLDTLS